MSKKENLCRQFEELEALMAIFGRDVEDLRTNCKKPLDIRISLTPTVDSNSENKIYVKTKLHIICSRKYPKTIPKIDLDDTIGISNSIIEEFLKELQKQANLLKGEVMIYDLAHSVQNFLHINNKPPRGSFYDEMLEERKKREEEELMLKNEKQFRERQNLLDEVEKRKELFKKDIDQKSHRNLSDNNSHKRRGSSSANNSFSESNSYLCANNCFEHRNCETLYFRKTGRQISRGSCLDHYSDGRVSYSGIDLDSGQTLYITEWHLKYCDIEKKCVSNCYWLEQSSCNGHKVDEFINSIEKHIAFLSQLNHRNLIKYECVMCLKKKEGLFIWLVQDNSFGTRLSNISLSLGWCMDGLHMVAKSVLDALIYLHNIGISYCNILESTIFFDNFGTIRCTDFSFVPHLIQISTGKVPTQGDLPALGSLLENLTPTLNYEIKDFIEKCNSTRTLSALELLEHPFIALHKDKKTLNKNSDAIENDHSANKDNLNFKLERSIPYMSILSIPNLPCRLQTEFEVLQYLGKGAFGDVLKVRNNLDNREYAIKRIPLPAKSKQLYKKMRREVELLSRLNHENVVRYFNSWIENTTCEELAKIDKLGKSENSSSSESIKILSTRSPQRLPSEESSSSLYNYGTKIPDSESDSDSIVFQYSNGEEQNVFEFSDEEDNENDKNKEIKNAKPMIQVMYIQMEFCEKSTLRLAIDENLFENTDRLWRLFREIVEGLSHIHQQGIIHRDLKPVNIFLDSRDQIKIGDFGLATTSFLALQNTERNFGNAISSKDDIKKTATGTGKVGTALYVAPELTENASKSTYNQKVDMYTLGIIFFEMSSPPFGTAMERIQTISNLRNPIIDIPDNMLSNFKYEKNINIIRCLLNHDASQRPTAEELLTSDLMPPAQLEARELQEMLRHVLDNPQSKAYKHLVARCLQQNSDDVLELTYHMGIVTINAALEFVKGKVLNIFQKHGGIEVSSPLLNPLSKNNYGNNSLVRLMTHSGNVVVLPNDLRDLFVKHIAVSGVNMIRRYSCDRVYREKKVFNFHPKQYYECAFDIITPDKGNNLVDAEVILIAYEIALEIPRIKERNMSIRMNHTNLLRAILMYCTVPRNEYVNLFASIMDFLEGKLSKFHFHSFVATLLEKSKSSATTLIDLLSTEFVIGPKNSIDNTPLKILLRGKGEIALLVTSAVRELESVVGLCQSFGVLCPITVCAGLPISYRRAHKGGTVWQIIADVKLTRNLPYSVLCTGERYDTALSEFQKQAQGCNLTIPNRGLSGVGFSFSLDKLAAAIGFEFVEEHSAIDVVVCVFGIAPPLKDAAYILRLLWSAGIRTGVVEANSSAEAQDLGRELGALHLILLGEHGDLRVRSWYQEKIEERVVTRTELITYIQKMLTKGQLNKQNSTSYESNNLTHYMPSTPNNKNNFINHIPRIEVIFLLREKLTANARKRMENQITRQMSPTLLQFGQKEQFVVLAVDVNSVIINIISGVINPREISHKDIDTEIQYIIERFPQYRRYILEITDKIIETLQSDNQVTVSLFTTTDSSYRIII